MNHLRYLQRKCKFGIEVLINPHREKSETVRAYLQNHFLEDMASEIPQPVLSKMIELNTLVQVRAYPDNTISYYIIHHYDTEEALQQMIHQIEIEDREVYNRDMEDYLND